MLDSHMQIHAEHNDTMKTQWRRATQSFGKIYLSLYLKGFERVTQGFTVRGSWRLNRTAIYWSPLLWPSALCLSRSPGLLNRRSGGPALCWMLAFSTASCHQRVWSPKPGLQTKWLPVFTELYNSSIAHSISPHNWPSRCVTSAVFGMACLIVIERK